MKIRFHPDAEIEFNEAVTWYARQHAGLDAEFVLCIDEALQRISRIPAMYPKVHNETRRTIVQDFLFPFFIL